MPTWLALLILAAGTLLWGMGLRRQVRSEMRRRRQPDLDPTMVP